MAALSATSIAKLLRNGAARKVVSGEMASLSPSSRWFSDPEGEPSRPGLVSSEPTTASALSNAKNSNAMLREGARQAARPPSTPPSVPPPAIRATNGLAVWGSNRSLTTDQNVEIVTGPSRTVCK